MGWQVGRRSWQVTYHASGKQLLMYILSEGNIMQVNKRIKSMTAYVFYADADGTNFKELEAEVKSDGGSVEQVADDLIVIRSAGGEFTLPLGFAVVISGGTGKVMTRDVFLGDYEQVGSSGGTGKGSGVVTGSRGGKSSKPSVDNSVSGNVLVTLDGKLGGGE